MKCFLLDRRRGFLSYEPFHEARSLNLLFGMQGSRCRGVRTLLSTVDRILIFSDLSYVVPFPGQERPAVSLLSLVLLQNPLKVIYSTSLRYFSQQEELSRSRSTLFHRPLYYLCSFFLTLTEWSILSVRYCRLGTKGSLKLPFPGLDVLIFVNPPALTHNTTPPTPKGCFVFWFPRP